MITNIRFLLAPLLITIAILVKIYLTVTLNKGLLIIMTLPTRILDLFILQGVSQKRVLRSHAQFAPSLSLLISLSHTHTLSQLSPID